MKVPKPSKFHNNEPDFSRSLFQFTEDQEKSISNKISKLYGADDANTIMNEIKRLAAVYYGHKNEAMILWEKEKSTQEYFSEKDIFLITYGDLVTSSDEKPLETLRTISQRFFRGVFNTIHILPFFPYSSDRGFAIRDFRQVDPSLGTWDDINSLKDDFKLMFDGVFNHVSSKSYWFQEFLNGNPAFNDFFTAFEEFEEIPEEDLKKLLRPRTSSVLSEYYTYHGKKKVWTTFSADQIDLKFQTPMVLLRIIQILLIYVRQGADVIRLDAVTYLWDELGTSGAHLEQTHIIVKLFREILNAVAPHVALITETNVPHDDNISYFGNGYDEAQMVYNFPLPPLLLHTFFNGDSTKISSWASTLENPSGSATFFNFFDSHDGIGVSGARGILTDEEIEYIGDIVKKRGGMISYKSSSDGSDVIYELNITSYSALNPENTDEAQEFKVQRYLAARSIPLILIGVPGIYFHGLLGTRNDYEGLEREGENRSINRHVMQKDILVDLLEDRTSRAYMVSGGMSRIISKRIEEKAFHPNSSQEILHLDKRVFTVIRRAQNGEMILVIVNVTGESFTLNCELHDDFKDKKMNDLLSTSFIESKGNSVEIYLYPYDIKWLKPTM